MSAATPAGDSSPADDLISLGTIVGTHALRGEVRLHPFNQKSTSIKPRARVVIRRDNEGREVRIESLRSHGRVWIVKLQGTDTIEAAEKLVGSEICLPRSRLPRLRKDEIYHFDLIGMRVVTDTGSDLGVITEVMDGAGADICVVQGESGEVLIPMISDIVRQIDRATRLMTITPIPGLLSDD